MSTNTSIYKDYKEKALKYKIKYLELKKKMNESKNIKLGGRPQWYNNFSRELEQIYSSVNTTYYTSQSDVVLTGSGAIAYVLNYLNMNMDLDQLEANGINPHDLDSLYSSRTGIPNPDSILNYYINPAQKRETSVTFSLSESNPNYNLTYIKSFDVSKVEKVKSVKLGNINVINLNSLKGFYTPDPFDEPERKEKDLFKKNLIEKMIKFIYDNNRIHEFGFDEFVSSRFSKPTKSSGLFGPDSDDEFTSSRFSKPTKSSGMFGPDSDNESM